VKNPAWVGVAQGFRYVLASQVLVLILGFSKAFLIPLFLGVGNFGYWQIYVFYTVYVGVFGLGFNDGMYLRYGGYDMAHLPMATIRTAVRIYTLWLLVASTLVAWYFSYDADPHRRVTMYLVAANVVVMGLLAVFSLTFQATNQLKRFGIFNAADKVFFLLLLPPLVIFRLDSFLYLMWVDLASKLFVLAVVLLAHKELFIGVGVKLKVALRESSANIRAGIQLMLANITGMLVLGFGRFIIEYQDTLENYAYYAFGVSMTNLALVAISAMSVVIYPSLRRLPQEHLLSFYDTINRRLFAFNVLMLGTYFPAVYAIEWLLPKYLPVVSYLNVLFAITALQAKMQLLNNTYYKALRRESAMFSANLSSLLLVIVLSVAAYAFFRSIEAIAYAAMVTMMYRVYSSERYLRRQMGGRAMGVVVLEVLALLVFLGVTSTLTFHQAFLAIMVLIGLALFGLRDEVRALIRLAVGGVR
jgi:O-antigen/teichoic acid export membrane protein